MNQTRQCVIDLALIDLFLRVCWSSTSFQACTTRSA